MEHIKLFEDFASDDDGAKQAAEMKLEEIIGKMFPGQSYNTSANNKPGDYTIDADVDGDRTKFVFSEIYLTPDEFDKINTEIENGYDEYVEKLEALSDGVKFYNVGTMPEEKAISISIVY